MNIQRGGFVALNVHFLVACLLINYWSDVVHVQLNQTWVLLQSGLVGPNATLVFVPEECYKAGRSLLSRPYKQKLLDLNEPSNVTSTSRDLQNPVRLTLRSYHVTLASERLRSHGCAILRSECPHALAAFTIWGQTVLLRWTRLCTLLSESAICFQSRGFKHCFIWCFCAVWGVWY